MEAQLHLLPTDVPEAAPSEAEPAPRPHPADPAWRLDEPTRALGRRGVASARSALRAAPRYRRLEVPADQSATASRPASAA